MAADFSDPFLDELSGVIHGKKKSLRYFGDLEIEADSRSESLEIRVGTGVFWAILLLERKNRGSVYLRRATKPSKGKVLVRLEGMRLIRDAEGITRALRDTVSAGTRGLELPDLHSIIEGIWEPLCLGLAED